MDKIERKLKYLQLESVVIETLVLSANEKWVYTVIKSFRNRKSKLCFPSLIKIIERARLSKTTVLKCRKRLKEVGLIDWEKQEGWKKNTHYRFTPEDGSEQEISRVLENLQMVKKRTNIDGQKENQHMVKNGTIYGLDEKKGLSPEQSRDSKDSPMVKNRTPNHINQMNKPKKDGTDARPPAKAVGLTAPDEPSGKFVPMPEEVKKRLDKIWKGKSMPDKNRTFEEERKAELLGQAGALKEAQPGSTALIEST